MLITGAYPGVKVYGTAPVDTVEGKTAATERLDLLGLERAARERKGLVCVFFFRHSFSAEKSGARLNHAKGTCWPLCNRGLCENSFHHFEAGRYGPKASVEKRSNSFRGEATTAVKRQSAKKCIQPQPCVWTVICAMQLNSCFLKSCFFFLRA